MKFFGVTCADTLRKEVDGNAFSPRFAVLWFHGVALAAAFLGVPDVVLHSAAESIRTAAGMLFSQRLA